MNFEEVQKIIDDIMLKQNSTIHRDFDGYSPMEMHQILNFPFSEKCPIQMRKLSNEAYEQIPIFNLSKYLIAQIAKVGELKLTKTGALPTKIVAELYNQGFFKENYIEKGLVKLYKEADSFSVSLTRILLEISGIVKKRTGKLSLTKKGEKLSVDNHQLFVALFEAYTLKFNWGYYDNYDSQNIGRLGSVFSLILLLKYGNEKRIEDFYAEKYINAFPLLLDEVTERYRSAKEIAWNCYTFRTFEQFMHIFGLIHLEVEGQFLDKVNYISKTELLDKLFNLK